MHRRRIAVLRQLMASNKIIADSFKIVDGVVTVTTEQKNTFDRNMNYIKHIGL
jgi:hypothetical protein